MNLEELVASLDLDGAMRAVMIEAFRDEVPDVLRNEDFALVWPAVREQLKADLLAGSYRPLPARVCEVPKSELATRPIAVIEIRDRILYQALMALIGPHIDSHLTEEVWSARLYETRKGKLRMAKQPRAWARFQAKGRELAEEYEDVCMLTTDVTSYFEFVDLDRLGEMVRNVPGVDERSAALLMELLRGLTSEATGLHGIPQGPEVSSMLGNLYLSPFDALLRQEGLKFIRFQDDLKVFASTRNALRRAVLNLMPMVRAQHLNLSTSKTEILQGPAVLAHFEDARKDAIQYGLDVEAPGIGEDLHAFFDDAITDGVSARDVRFAVYRLQKRGDPHAVRWILEHLAEVPYLASLLVEYLSVHLEDPALGVEDRICDFLDDPEENISPHVELQLVRMLARAPSITDRSYEVAWRLFRDQTRSSLVREFAARCIGRHMRPQHRELLKAHFQTAVGDPALRRAILTALKESGVASSAFLREVEASDPSLAHTARYLRTANKLPEP